MQFNNVSRYDNVRTCYTVYYIVHVIWLVWRNFDFNLKTVHFGKF